MHTSPDFAALFSASPYPYLLIDTGYLIIGANRYKAALSARCPENNRR